MDSQIAKHFFGKVISFNDQTLVDSFLNKWGSLALDQCLQWFQAEYPNVSYCQYYARINDNVEAYAIIREQHKTARIFLGPICQNPHLLSEAVYHMFQYYKEKKFGSIYIQPDHRLTTDFPKVMQTLQDKLRYREINDNRSWTTITLDLQEDLELIRKNYRQNHKRNISKAKKWFYNQSHY